MLLKKQILLLLLVGICFSCSVTKTNEKGIQKKSKISVSLERHNARKYKQKIKWFKGKYTVWYYRGTIDAAYEQKKSKGYFATLDQFKSGASIIDKYSFVRGLKVSSLTELEDSLKARDFYQDILVRPNKEKGYKLIQSTITVKEEQLKYDTNYIFYGIKQDYNSIFDNNVTLSKLNYNYVIFSPKSSLVISGTDKDWLNYFVKHLVKVKV